MGLAPLKVGAFFFGGVEMDDAGAGAPAPMDRRYSNEACWDATRKYIDAAVAAEAVGIDSFWTTEHHFQYEGYEVIPNGLLINHLDCRTYVETAAGHDVQRRPAMEPDPARRGFLDAAQPVGRPRHPRRRPGTVPREVVHFNEKGVSIGSHDNPDAIAADEHNREVFEESMEIIRRSLDNETFSFQGKHFTLPVPGIPDRGATVARPDADPPPDLSLRDLAGRHQSADLGVRPSRRPWRGVLEPASVVHQAILGPLRGALPGRPPGRDAGFGEKRMIVVATRIEDTHEEAWRTARNGHDEFWKFLGPYGWSRGYMAADGRPAQAGLIPTLEESTAQNMYLIGTAEEVAEKVQSYRDLLGIENLTIFPHLIGDPYAKAAEQMARFMEEVVPLVS